MRDSEPCFLSVKLCIIYKSSNDCIKGKAMSRTMSFSGFLKAYCNSLCGLSDRPTTSVKKLHRRVSDDCPAAVEAHAKELMRKRIESLLESSRTSTRRLCLKVGLNEGNFYAFLKGDVSKLSRSTARRLLQAAEHLSEP